MTIQNTNIIWFRNDLRTLDNPALIAALETEQVRAVFLITLKQWQEQHNWGDNKVAFVLQSAIALQQQLIKLNIQLDFIDCEDFKNVPTIISKYLKQHNAIGLYYNCEYELNEIRRDQAVSKLLKDKVSIHEFHSQILIKPGKILTKQNTPYSVFTPFKSACYVHLHKVRLRLEPKPKSQNSTETSKANELNRSKYAKYLDNKIVQNWPAGEVVALKKLQKFCEGKIHTYKQQRDFPALDGTSSLSPYLAVGSISPKQCFLAALAANDHELSGGNPNITCWQDELLWRDFYKQIMFHFPDLCKGKNFNSKYDKLKWQKSNEHLQLWQEGKTGIPIIDSAMRQLVVTGWMHNRLRMVVAMFLTKNLLIDWRLGEDFFSKHLIDLDFASNNGGWQWSASTGTDAVPYFRIFNPISQSERFDPEGNFIKKFCPELKPLNNKQIHNPSANITSQQLEQLPYPQVMVDIAKSRLRALEYFKNL